MKVKTIVLLIVASTEAVPGMSGAQAVRYSLMAGVGTTMWSDRSAGSGSASVGALALEWRRTARASLRAEAGMQVGKGDLGASGLTDGPTSMTLNKLVMSGAVRVDLGSPTPVWLWFLDAGAHQWWRSGCNVDVAAGGSSGAYTAACDDWAPEPLQGAQPLRAEKSGTALIIGAGIRRQRLGILTRYVFELRNSLDLGALAISDRQFTLSVEWAFNGR
jgi:hypothetical protein